MTITTADENRQATAPHPGREAVLAGSLILLVYLVLYAGTFRAVGAYNDDGVYVALGKALESGAGYRSIHLVGHPVQLKYPPGYPALLALIWHVAGTLSRVQLAAAVINILAMGVGAGLLWWFARARLSAGLVATAGLVVLPFLLDPLIQLSTIPLTEPLLTLGRAVVLLLVYGITAESAPGPAPRVVLTATALALGATALVHSLGVVLIPLVIVALIFARRPWRDVLTVGIGATLPVAAWAVVRAHLLSTGPIRPEPDETPYSHWLSFDSPGTALTQIDQITSGNWDYYVRTISSCLTPLPWLSHVLLGAGAVALGAGLWQLGRRTSLIVALLPVGSAFAILIWPWGQERLLLPLLPFLGLVAAGGAGGMARGMRRPVVLLGRAVAVAIIALVLWRQAGIRERAAADFTERRHISLFTPSAYLLELSRQIATDAQWINQHASPADRIMSPTPAAIFLYTGRPTVPGAPAESDIGPSIFDHPGRWTAGRILADTITLITSDWNRHLLRDADTIAVACPGVIRRVDVGTEPQVPAVFAVSRDEACLRTKFLTGNR